MTRAVIAVIAFMAVAVKAAPPPPPALFWGFDAGFGDRMVLQRECSAAPP